MRLVPRAFALFLLVIPFAVAATTPPKYPSQEQIGQFLQRRLDKQFQSSADSPDVVAAQKAEVIKVVGAIMKKQVGDPNAPDYPQKLQAFLNKATDPGAVSQMVAAAMNLGDKQTAQLGADVKSGGKTVVAADSGEGTQKSADVDFDPELIGLAAVSVYQGVQSDISGEVARQGREQEHHPETPGVAPGGGGQPAPPVITDPRLNGVGVIARHDADQNPKDSGAQGVATVVSHVIGDYSNGERYGKRYLSDGGQDPDTLVAAGRSAIANGDNDFAQQAGQAAAQGDPSNQFAEALAKLSEDHVGGVDIDGALQKAGAGVLNADQVNSEGQTLIDASQMSAVGGGVSAGAGGAGNPQTAAAIAAAAQQAVTTPPTKVSQSAALTRDAAQAMGVEDYEKAQTVATQAIDLNPRNAQAWNYRAIADTKLAQYDKAVYDASFSLGLVPGNAPALQTRAWAFAKQGEYKEALADANFTIEKDPANAFAFQNRAFAQAGLRDRQGALDSLRKSAELDPRFQDKYQTALQAPQDSDLTFLFSDAPAGKSAPAGAAGPKSRFLRLVLLSMLGGLIIALGVLNVFSERWRDRMRQTVRRVIGAARPAGNQSGSFWGGQYEMVKSIGTGGMGVVYEAVDKSLDRRVAIKKMRDEVRMDPAERQRFVQEARVVASLHHPNIVDIFAIVEDEQDVYLVFEYVSGKTLSEILRGGALDLAQARRVLAGACAAVEHAHKNKIIHRDIKPSNIMLSDEGAVKVMDFGVARQAKDAMTRQALTNTIVGTPPYMAPEQEQGSVRKESDIFGLGAVFYEMLTGRLPFQGQGAGMLLNKINGKHALASSVVPSLPAGLDAVIAKALAADPEKRYQSAGEFLAAVDAFAASPTA